MRYKNFLSTGDNWIEVSLNKKPTTLVVGENGAGKSTMLDALCFGLFGKPFRKIKKAQLQNSVNTKGCEVEIDFTIGSKKYRVRRGIGPTIFEVFVNDQLININAAAKDYQSIFERSILNLNFQSFTQIVILGSSTFVPFMQLSAQNRRDVIEDLLDIKIFSTMNSLLKEKVLNHKSSYEDNKRSIEFNNEKIDTQKKYIEEVKQADEKRKDEVSKEIVELKGKIKDYAKQGIECKEECQNLEHKINELEWVRQELDTSRDALRLATQRYDKAERDFKEAIDNTNCNTCGQPIDETTRQEQMDDASKRKDKAHEQKTILSVKVNDLEIHNKEIVELQKKYTIQAQKCVGIASDIKAAQEQVTKLEKYVEEYSSAFDLDAHENLLNELVELHQTLEIEKCELLEQSQVYIAANDLLKDKGIKTQIVRQYVPIMNKLVNKYLAAMEFFVKFEIDEKFQETIKSRYRDDFSYGSFSEGEKMRIDLALLLTWRAIAKMKNSMNTNLLILDEVFDASLDSAGCEEFLKLINELGKTTNVFVISHKGDVLQDKFNNVMRFEKHKNFSRVV